MTLKRTVSILLVFAIIWIGCSGTAHEEKARGIYQRARELLQQGRMMEAFQEYDRLMEYKKTSSFQKAKAELLNEGISIGKAVHSYSIQRMFKVKNKLIREQQHRHPDGNVLMPVSTKDGWGSYIRVQYSTGPKFMFAVVSPGPDRNMGTKDDLRLYHQHGKHKPPADGVVQSKAPSSVKLTPNFAESSIEIGDLLKGKKR
jgi:hypothetical protein